MKADAKALYDNRYSGDYMDSDAYSTWAHADLSVHQVVEVLSHVPIIPKRILDYGCGVGRWVSTLSGVFPEASISGVEISETATKKVQERFPQHVFSQLRDGKAPFDDEQFDFVFTYHVLEHVDDIGLTIQDISRLLCKGGYACIIFPCGNKGSLLERLMRLVDESIQMSHTGETAYFFEIPDGHVRRVTSDNTVALFEANGLTVTEQMFSGHFFGTIDWLCRGTGPAYINRVFQGRPPVGRFAQLRIETWRRILLMTHRFIQRRNLDVKKKRGILKQMAVIAVKSMADICDYAIVFLATVEWRLLKRRKGGSAQFLLFKKP